MGFIESATKQSSSNDVTKQDNKTLLNAPESNCLTEMHNFLNRHINRVDQFLYNA